MARTAPSGQGWHRGDGQGIDPNDVNGKRGTLARIGAGFRPGSRLPICCHRSKPADNFPARTRARRSPTIGLSRGRPSGRPSASDRPTRPSGHCPGPREGKVDAFDLLAPTRAKTLSGEKDSASAGHGRAGGRRAERAADGRQSAGASAVGRDGEGKGLGPVAFRRMNQPPRLF